MDADAIRKYAELANRKKELESEAKSLGAEMTKMEPHLLDQMADAGMDSMRFEGLGTVYINSRVWAKVTDKQRAVAALQAAGLAEYVEPKYNHNSLSAYVAEQVRNGEPLPAEFNGIIEPNEVFSLRVRAA